MQEVNCNFCKGSDTCLIYPVQISLSGKKEEFKLIRCKKCGLVYINPQPEKEEISSYYPQEEYYSFSQLERKKENKLSLLEKLRDVICQKAVLYYYKADISKISGWQKFLTKTVTFLGKERLAAFAAAPMYIKKGRILDIGCGDGIFLDYLRKIGWETCGVEINKSAVMKGRANGLNILDKDLLEAGFPSDYFDVVRMWSVLEHLHKPFKTLKEIHRILKPEGALIAQMPNFDSLASKVFKQRWAGLTRDLHLYHFDSKSLRNILTASGFEISEIYTSSVGTIGCSLKIGKFYYWIAPILIFFDLFFDKFGLGDCLVVFAKKKSN